MTDKISKKKTLQHYCPELILKWNFLDENKSDHHSVNTNDLWPFSRADTFQNTKVHNSRESLKLDPH